MNQTLGKFITVEGSEGVGKTTNIDFVKRFLTHRGIDLVVTREPGGTPLAEDIRELLLVNRTEKVDDTAELLLVFAARSQHIHQHILPALKRGQWVLCDRFTDSTYAYQGGGRGLNTELITQLENTVQQGFQPDLTLYLDIDVATGLARASKRGALDRFENETLAFFERVRAAYLARVNGDPKRFRLVDAAQPLVEVQKQIEAVLTELLNN